MKIRRARYEDGLFVYALSQEPSVKTMSLRSETFTIDEHLHWWERRFLSIAQAWWIGEVDGRPVGYVRYGRCGGGECKHTAGGAAEVSLAVHPFWRGRGFARELLRRTDRSARRALFPLPGSVRVLALIRPENTPSILTFARAGYQHAWDEQRLGVLMRVFARW